ncbi:hypothetical protein KC19_VG234600 [Ceratodon purpureus]|uniref:Uncharacterized protein n=1 Tax=Ceratodon purpureus TaxID=3225 RepID=A0A8T0HT32_CERPU|nr:hypothetical protein KC19_VG234600 [Ceratodon purpureus]
MSFGGEYLVRSIPCRQKSISITVTGLPYPRYPLLQVQRLRLTFFRNDQECVSIEFLDVGLKSFCRRQVFCYCFGGCIMELRAGLDYDGEVHQLWEKRRL